MPDHFAAHGHPATHFKHQPAQCICLVVLVVGQQVHTEHVIQRGNGNARISHPGGIVLLLDQHIVFIIIMLIRDFTHNGLNDVFKRHQTISAAILIHDNSKVHVAGLHLEQQVRRRHRQRHIEHIADDAVVALHRAGKFRRRQ